MRKPLCIDLFCGLGGWTEGFLSEGWRVVGFDIEQHVYGEERYPAQLVLQDVRTIHGKQFKDADMIVASSPCQAYSYMRMPWTRARERAVWYRDPAHPERLEALNKLFNQPRRIQREACEAAGRYIPMIQENVGGAEAWVGKAAFRYGSFLLWGDVPALMPKAVRAVKVPGQDWNRFKETGEVSPHWRAEATKNTGGSWFNIGSPGQKVVNQNPTRAANKKHGPKAGAAFVAKIPFALASHIARVYYPRAERAA